MAVFLKAKSYDTSIVTDKYKLTEKIGKIILDLDFSNRIPFTTNYTLTKKTHSNENLHGTVLPNLYEIGALRYKGEKFKIIISDYDFGLSTNPKNPKNIPAGNPQFINNEYVVLLLNYHLNTNLLRAICIHEVGHIITLRNTSSAVVLSDMSAVSMHMFDAGVEEGKADAFMYAQIKNSTIMQSLVEAKKGYYFLFYGDPIKDPILLEYRKRVRNYEEYFRGYSSIIYKDIYSSPKVKEFSK